MHDDGGGFSGIFSWHQRAVERNPSRSFSTVDRQKIEDEIAGLDKTPGYNASLPGSLWYSFQNSTPPLWQFHWDLPTMLLHERVDNALACYRSAIADCEFEVDTKDPAIEAYALEQYQRLWARSLSSAIQEIGYPWGYAGSEWIYRHNDAGQLAIDELKPFDYRHVKALIRGNDFWGVRVYSVKADNRQTHVDLWGPSLGLSKGFWYAHNPQPGSLYGKSQCYGAWLPWRRLAGRDGGQDITDLAVFRFGVRGPKVYFPHGFQPTAPGTTSPGMKNQDYARFVSEQYKAGGGITLPSERDAKGNLKWDAEFPDSTLNVDSLLNYLRYLNEAIDLGIGIPPELVKAADTGSGYSGREIPLETYFARQHSTARSIVRQLDRHVRQLVKWVFGPDASYTVDVVSPAETRQKRRGGQGGQALGQPVGTGPQIPSNDSRGQIQPQMLSAPLPESIKIKLGDTQAEMMIAAILAKLAPEAQKAFAAVVRAAVEASPAEQWPKIQAAIEAYREIVIDALGEARLNAALLAMHRVGRSLRISPAAVSSGTPPGAPPAIIGATGEPGRFVRLPMIDEAVASLQAKRLLTPAAFDALTAAAKAEAFTVAGDLANGALDRIRDILASNVREGASKRRFAEIIREQFEDDPFLSPAHQRTVFRTNVHAAYSDGQDRILDHPLVGDEFPYVVIYPIRDGRVRPWHLATENHGIDGTAVYRRDDPVWQQIRPPSDFNCRCGWSPLTVEMAAAKGVKEAQIWLQTGLPPANPARCQLPPNWKQTAGWSRRPVPVMMAAEPTREKGRWITIGGSKGGDGKRVGGSPVYIVNGRITKGHPSLTGKKIAALKDDGPDDDPSTHRQQLNQSKQYAVAKLLKSAKQQGIHHDDLHALAGEMLAHHNAGVDQHNSDLKNARRFLDQWGGSARVMAAKRAKGGKGQFEDAAAIKGLDQVAAAMAAEADSSLYGRDDATERLFEMLTEGNRTRMTKEEAYQAAHDHFAEAVANGEYSRAKAGQAIDAVGDAFEQDGDDVGDFDFGANETVPSDLAKSQPTDSPKTAAPPMPPQAGPKAWEKTGKDIGTVHHGGQSAIDKIDPTKLQRRDEGAFGKGFYTTREEKTAKGYGPVVSSFDLADDARVLSAPDKLADAHPELVKAVHEWGKANGWTPATVGDDMADAQWGAMVGEYAEANGYDAVHIPDGHFGEEIVVKNHGKVKSRSASAKTAPHEADHSDALNAIEPNTTGYVAGHPVQRLANGQIRMESDGFHVIGAEAVNERIRRNWKDQQAEGSAIQAAIQRHGQYDEPHPFLDPARSEAADKRRSQVPNGVRAVSLDPETRGRVGKVIRDEQGNVGLRLDGTPNAKVSDFEPLDEKHSWRTNRPVDTPKVKAEQPSFFSATLDRIRTAAAEVQANPSDAQRDAGNHKMGHVTWQGLPITIEVAKGMNRSGKSKAGVEWSIELKDHYGYIKRTESAADRDHIDVYLSEDFPDSEIVFIINQHRLDGSFDEHKCILGQTNCADAKAAYLRNYADGWKGCGSIAPMTVAAFRDWIADGDTSKPVES